MSEPEIWQAIPGWEGLYEASDLGRVRSVPHTIPARWGKTRLTKARIKSQNTAGSDYCRVKLSKPGQQPVTRYVHRLVALAFLGLPEDGQVVCHNNGNAHDNRAANLRWGTPSENARDQVKHGTHRATRVTACPRGHGFEQFNIMRGHLARGYRACRSCDLANKRKLPAGMTVEQLADLIYVELEARNVPA